MSAWREGELGVAWKLNQDDPALYLWACLRDGSRRACLKFLDEWSLGFVLICDRVGVDAVVSDDDDDDDDDEVDAILDRRNVSRGEESRDIGAT